MKKCVKIDRSRGNAVIKRMNLTDKQYADRDLEKKLVWVEYTQGTVDVFDPKTERLKKVEVLPDLSDLSIPVAPDVRMVANQVRVPRAQDEIDRELDKQVANLDKGMILLLDTIMEVVASGKGLDWDSFSSEQWDNVNARRVLRGQPPLVDPKP